MVFIWGTAATLPNTPSRSQKCRAAIKPTNKIVNANLAGLHRAGVDPDATARPTILVAMPRAGINGVVRGGRYARRPVAPARCRSR
eukprot:7230392-Lingulodinium_polyedra.AAC.1